MSTTDSRCLITPRAKTGERSRSVRTTVSIPGRLRERMREFNTRFNVNWSAVAAEAFSKAMDSAELEDP